MKIAAFYENIWEAVQSAGMGMHDALSMLREEGMEMLYMTPESWKRDRGELSEIMGKLNLEIEGMHAFCDFTGNPDSLRYQEVIDLAAESGAGNILIIPGMYSSGNSALDLERMLSGIIRATAYGSKKNIPVLMEDYDGAAAPYNCIAGLQYFMDRTDGLGCAFDTGNFVMFREDEMAALDVFADKIRTVHLKDRCSQQRHKGDTPFVCADGKPVYACRIGSGDIRMAEIIRKLKQRNYGGNVIVELYACDPEYVLQDMIESIRWVKEQIQ